ncbi:hypothetical protein FNF29_06449 [Cafeteria roenbergensis]|uniref:MACPF domain-containing protein n=1 Tax=Cafeteria roenbergensis TaxID=33653 RepID=A0A5A8C8A6_CAFRO|nr:hypothetical protein FNF29_06449 [Cafeteria roenbergensis]|eukprot:KAA0148824.1 hypothetical protein FNF29_06449 [Cafeteria roenbergensis]
MAPRTSAAVAALVGACLAAHALAAGTARSGSRATAGEGDHPEFVFPELHDDRDVVNNAEEQRWVYDKDGKLARSITSVLPAHNGILAHPPGAPGADVAGLGYDLFRDRFVHAVFDQGCTGDMDEDGPECEFVTHNVLGDISLPPSMVLLENAVNGGDSSAAVIEDEQQQREHASTSIGLGASLGIFKGSLGVSWSSETEAATFSTSSKAVAEHRVSVYSVVPKLHDTALVCEGGTCASVVDESLLDDAFVEAVQALPLPTTEDGKVTGPTLEAYKSFVHSFGTHLVSKVDVGGKVTVTTLIDKATTSSSQRKARAAQVATAFAKAEDPDARATVYHRTLTRTGDTTEETTTVTPPSVQGMDGFLAGAAGASGASPSVGVSASSSSESSKSNRNNRESETTKFLFEGCDPTVADKDSISDWQATCNTNPTVIAYKVSALEQAMVFGSNCPTPTGETVAVEKDEDQEEEDAGSGDAAPGDEDEQDGQHFRAIAAGLGVPAPRLPAMQLDATGATSTEADTHDALAAALSPADGLAYGSHSLLQAATSSGRRAARAHGRSASRTRARAHAGARAGARLLLGSRARGGEEEPTNACVAGKLHEHLLKVKAFQHAVRSIQKASVHLVVEKLKLDDIDAKIKHRGMTVDLCQQRLEQAKRVNGYRLGLDPSLSPADLEHTPSSCELETKLFDLFGEKRSGKALTGESLELDMTSLLKPNAIGSIQTRSRACQYCSMVLSEAVKARNKRDAAAGGAELKCPTDDAIVAAGLPGSVGQMCQQFNDIYGSPPDAFKQQRPDTPLHEFEWQRMARLHAVKSSSCSAGGTRMERCSVAASCKFAMFCSQTDLAAEANAQARDIAGKSVTISSSIDLPAGRSTVTIQGEGEEFSRGHPLRARLYHADDNAIVDKTCSDVPFSKKERSAFNADKRKIYWDMDIIGHRVVTDSVLSGDSAQKYKDLPRDVELVLESVQSDDWMTFPLSCDDKSVVHYPQLAAATIESFVSLTGGTKKRGPFVRYGFDMGPQDSDRMCLVLAPLDGSHADSAKPLLKNRPFDSLEAVYKKSLSEKAYGPEPKAVYESRRLGKKKASLECKSG